MKRPIKKSMIWILTILIITIIVIAFRTFLVSAISDLHAPPVPTQPMGNGPQNGATATPDRTQGAINMMVTPSFIAPFPTKIVISKTTDLSPELNITDKYTLVISHKDGNNEEVLVGPVPQGDISLNIPDAIMKKLNLQTGDKIISKTNNRVSVIGGPTLVPTPENAKMPTTTPEINPPSITPAYP